jgi:uncharacterized phage protein (TIGR01671 family)
MREILFKTKREDTGEWVGCICTVTNERIYIAGIYPLGDEPSISGQFHDIRPETICQYTGLTDKNNRQIWENDICKISTVLIDEEDGFFVVKWDNDGARFALEGNGLTVDFDIVYGTDCEVIGNIFDNPELIKGEDDDEK